MTEPPSSAIAYRKAAGTSAWQMNLALGVGAIGSMLVALGAFAGARLLVPPFEGWALAQAFRGNTGYQVGSTAYLLGTVALLAAWLRLRHASGNRQRLALCLWVAPLLVSVPLGDMYNYVEQGWAVLHGFDPTVTPAGTAGGPFDDWVGVWKGTTVQYPPLGLGLQAVSVWLAGANPLLSLWAMRMWPVVGAIALAWGVGRLARERGLDARSAVWFAVANPATLVYGIAEGHNDLLAVGLATAGIACLVRQPTKYTRLILGLVLVLIVGLIKPTALLLLAVVPTLLNLRATGTRDRLTALRALVRGGSLVAAGLVMLFFTSLMLPGRGAWLTASGDPGYFSSSLPRVVQQLLDQRGGPLADAYAGLLLPLCLALTVLTVVGVVVWWRIVDPYAVVAVTVAALMTFGPAARPWYLLPAVPALALILTSESVRLRWAVLAFTWSFVSIPTVVTLTASQVAQWGATLLVGGILLMFAPRRVDGSTA